jgi:hypothetical protein
VGGGVTIAASRGLGAFCLLSLGFSSLAGGTMGGVAGTSARGVFATGGII